MLRYSRFLPALGLLTFALPLAGCGATRKTPSVLQSGESERPNRASATPATTDAKDRLKLANSAYGDPKGFFTIRPPAGWSVYEYRSDPRGKVGFNWITGSRKVQLKVIGAANPFTDFDALVQDCRNGVERLRARFGGTYRIETIEYLGEDAALLHTSLPNGFRQYQVQLISGGNYYTLAYGTDGSLYEEYLPLVKASMNTLEALPKASSTENARAHTVASKIRLAEMYRGVGRRDWALTAVNEGLAVDVSNVELLRLKEELEDWRR